MFGFLKRLTQGAPPLPDDDPEVLQEMEDGVEAVRQAEAAGALPAGLSRRVQWLDRWPEPPIRGVILANGPAIGRRQLPPQASRAARRGTA